MNNRIEYRPFEWFPNDFSLKGTDEKSYTLEQFRGSKGLVVMFICNHCPYVKAITNQLVTDIEALEGNGISSIAIMSNDVVNYPDDSFENMKKFSERNNFNFPYVIDETQNVAKDFFGFDADLKLQYRGRLNSAGKNQTSNETKNDLVDAMLSISKNGIRPEEQFPSIGCSIKWKK